MYCMAIEDMAAELRKDAMASSELQDSRKRPLDEDEENGTSKKSHYSGGEFNGNLKLLVPSAVVGGIIGKGGETLAQVQKDCGVRIKMSKSNDFYPGTSDRVCLITGGIDPILEAFSFVVQKIAGKDTQRKPYGEPEKPSYDHNSKFNVHIKILVPNSTAGMIIGKAGSYVKQINKECGAQVQISQKAKDKSLQERCVTVSGDVSCIINATHMILSKIVEDPLSNSCLNISYSDISGPVANNNPSGSPYAPPRRQQSSAHHMYNSLNDNVSSSLSAMLPNEGSLNLSLNLGAPFRGTSFTSQLLEHIKFTLHGSGYNEQASSEIIAAMVTLAKYGILGMGLGVTRGAASPAVNNSSLLASRSFFDSGAMESSYSKNENNLHHTNDMYGVMNNNGHRMDYNTNSGLSMMVQFDGTRSQRNSSINARKSDTSDEHTLETEEIEVPENIVGAIFGPGGRSLIEIQLKSGTSIKISKKGNFAPGTRNRVVTITGSPNAVNTARFFIEKRIDEEERKRAHSHTNT